MTATSHRIFNLSAAIALSFHWWVWLLFLLAASLPDQLEPAKRRQSRFRSHRGLFHTYSVWIILGLAIFWLPAVAFRISGVPVVFDAGVKMLIWIYLAGVLCHLLADTGSVQGCSILLPCHCGQLGRCRCHWYTRRLSLKWYRTGEFSEAVFLLLFCGLCAAIAAWRWKHHFDFT
jgi:LexA-binding, inner membrane-associated putative hydrolase